MKTLDVLHNDEMQAVGGDDNFFPCIYLMIPTILEEFEKREHNYTTTKPEETW